MSYSINYNPQTGVIETKVDGNLTINLAQEISSEAMKLAVEKGSKLFLNDFSAATIKMSIKQLYLLPEMVFNLAVSMGLNARELKRANIFSLMSFPDTSSEKFAENVKRNRGHNVRNFLDAEDARNWLLEK